MILIKQAKKLSEYIANFHRSGGKIGFVPTMGALHAGHISLIDEAVKENELSVCSIFVNPAQFNDAGDFEKYPITLEKDILALEEAGCGILLLPSVKEIYPDGYENLPQFDLGYLETTLEGEFRPGHFQGVCNVVSRLLEIVQPDVLYLGQKDFQQCMVIARMFEIKGLTDKIKLSISPTLREDDGLAMSSRNMRLSSEARKKAPLIHSALQRVKAEISHIDVKKSLQQAKNRLEEEGFKVDYLELRRANDLHVLNEFPLDEQAVLLVAAYIDGIRLIDNIIINPDLISNQ